MLNFIPAYVVVTFIVTVLLTLMFFVRSMKYKTITLFICVIWLALQGRIAYTGFYHNEQSIPPRFALATIPALAGIILLFATKAGRKYIDSTDLRAITLLNIVRIPVEFILYLLAVHKAIPDLMTFAGRNLDIISGITAPVVYIICFRGKNVINRKLLLGWHIVALLLLLNVVINAVLSLPAKFQLFAFEQPNIAVLYFPFVWLPSFIVMAVLLGHLISIRILTKNKTLPLPA